MSIDVNAIKCICAGIKADLDACTKDGWSFTYNGSAHTDSGTGWELSNNGRAICIFDFNYDDCYSYGRLSDEELYKIVDVVNKEFGWNFNIR